MNTPDLLDRPIHIPKLVIAGYLLGACITYGHAWWHVKPANDAGMSRWLLTVAAAAAWPIYVPVCLFEPAEAKAEPVVEK